MKEAEQKNTEQNAETNTQPEAVSEAVEEEDIQNDTPKSDAEVLKGIADKYDLTVMEKKLIYKVVSLLETHQMKRMLPPQNVGDSVFKMYASDPEPSEFLVDRVEFDDYGWILVSYEKFGTSEMEFVFSKKDYKKLFFDTAEEAREYYKNQNKDTKDKKK